MELLEKPRILSYFTCNVTSLLCLSIILPTMVFSIIIIKMFVSSDIYKTKRICSPVSYYFGEKTGCRQLIKDSIYIENFETNEKLSFGDVIATSSNYITRLIEYLKSGLYETLVKMVPLF